MTLKNLTFIEHLEEFRLAVIKSVIFVIVSSVFVYTFTDKIFSQLVMPLGGTLVFIAPQEAFIANIKLAIFGGLYFSSPFVLYQVWDFISAGLQKRERARAAAYVFLSFIFFIIGSYFGYFFIAPIGIKFLLGFGTAQVIPMISVEKYVSFVCVLTLVFGLMFQLPLLILLLSKLGIVSPVMLARNRKYAILMIFIISAILTPPDVITQCIMAFPLIALYELSIFLTRITTSERESKR
ncbi:MAG: twin-arginine translocase subunit TatC [Candidatus Omnitrophica bacterium]|nr:twin-arginine translocase subunit TatC [Candidatus Omnitrophota bacterium]